MSANGGEPAPQHFGSGGCHSAEAATAPGRASDAPAAAQQQEAKPSGGSNGPSQPAASAAGAVTLEALRQRLEAFAAEREWEQFHTPRNLLLALVGEVGELAELFQWRPDAQAAPGLPGWSEGQRAALGEEMADVLLYLVRMADVCAVDLGAAALAKMERNAGRYPAHACRGSSAKYTAYQEGGKEPQQQQPGGASGRQEEEQQQQQQQQQPGGAAGRQEEEKQQQQPGGAAGRQEEEQQQQQPGAAPGEHGAELRQQQQPDGAQGSRGGER